MRQRLYAASFIIIVDDNRRKTVRSFLSSDDLPSSASIDALQPSLSPVYIHSSTIYIHVSTCPTALSIHRALLTPHRRVIARGQKPKPGPQSGRQTSENSGEVTTLSTKVITLFFLRNRIKERTQIFSLWIRRVLFTRIPIDTSGKRGFRVKV